MSKKLKKYYVSELAELKNSRCFGYEVAINKSLVQCFLIYHNNNVYSYFNSCPHTGVNLDWVPHQFMDKNYKLIQCATHGALFNTEDGYCMSGPCLGDHLQKVENVIIDGNIYLIL